MDRIVRTVFSYFTFYACIIYRCNVDLSTLPARRVLRRFISVKTHFNIQAIYR